MAGDAVNLDLLLLQEDVVADLEHAYGGVQDRTHEVGQVEAIGRGAYEERTAFGKSCDGLAGDIVVGDKSSAVRVALVGGVEQALEYLAHIDLYSHQFLILLEETYPAVEVGRAVVAVDHCDEVAVRGGDHVDHLVRL